MLTKKKVKRRPIYCKKNGKSISMRFRRKFGGKTRGPGKKRDFKGIDDRLRPLLSLIQNRRLPARCRPNSWRGGKRISPKIDKNDSSSKSTEKKDAQETDTPLGSMKPFTRKNRSVSTE